MKKTAVIIGILAVIGLGAFAYLGGFEEVPIEVKPSEDIRLYGLTYRGTPQDERLRETFEQIEALKEANPEAVMHTIYFIEPAGKLDTMQVFVGLDRLVSGSEDFLQEKVIAADRVLVADIQINKLVMPRPERVKGLLIDFAEEQDLRLQGLFIDRLLAEDHVQVLAPLKE